jgi:hypothetical protein
MRHSVVTGRTIYEDARITLSTTSVAFRGYWFPLGVSRTVRIEQLQSAVEHPRGDPDLPRWPRWGRGANGTWFPLEWSRPRRDTAVVMTFLDGRRVAVTPANPQRFLTLLVDLSVPVSRLEPEPPEG